MTDAPRYCSEQGSSRRRRGPSLALAGERTSDVAVAADRPDTRKGAFRTARSRVPPSCGSTRSVGASPAAATTRRGVHGPPEATLRVELETSSLFS